MGEAPTYHRSFPHTRANAEPFASADGSDGYRRRHGVREFFRTFDKMWARPTWRQGDVPLPILLVTGPEEATGAAAQALANRCEGNPYAHIVTNVSTDEPATVENHSAPYEPLVRQLRDAQQALTSVAPRREPRLRFPLFDQVQWLLELPMPEKGVSAHKAVGRAIRSQLRHPFKGQDWTSFWANVRAYAEGPLPAWAAAAAVLSVAWAARLATLFGVVAVLALLSVGVVHVLWLSRTWAGSHRYRWFLRQPYGLLERQRGQSGGFKNFAVQVMEARGLAEGSSTMPDNGPEQQFPRRARKDAGAAIDAIERLLVHAFLEDIRQGYERRLGRILWRRVAWARTVYPVLLVEGDGTRLVRRIEEVRADTCDADPLLVVVMTGNRAGLDAVEHPGSASGMAARPDGAEDLWHAWQQNLARDRSWSSHRLLEVELDFEHAALLSKTQIPPAPRRRVPLLANPILLLIVVLGLVASSLTYVGVTTVGNCADGIRRTPTKECVGITDGRFTFHNRLDEILRTINEKNRDIVGSAGPYVTVVYFGALSLPVNSPPGADDLLADVHGELAGIAVGQRRLIENGKDGTKLQMRVLVANAGAEYRYAEEVAGDVLELVDEDHTVIGVVGLGESRREVQRAIERMGSRALPMVSTTATFDDIGRVRGSYVPSFFPLAPPNSELANAAARWAKQGIAEAGVEPVRTAAVFMDATQGDLYSKDLGQRVVQAIGDGAMAVEYSGAASLQPKISQICSAEPPDLIYYAGRSTQFGTFIDAIGKSQCHGIVLMTGDAVTQYVNDHGAQLGRNRRVRLYFTPLAAPSSWATIPEQFRSGFYDDLAGLIAQLGLDRLPNNRQPSKEYAALAEDAADALMRAAQAAFDAQQLPSTGERPEMLDRGGVLLALEKLEPVDGASGLVKLHGAANGHHPRERPVLLATVDQDGRQLVVRQCGRLYLSQSPSSDQCP